MKINKIKNAYIKNKPNYNYLILDLDGQFVAKGHLLNARLKYLIMLFIQYDMNELGLVLPKILSYMLFSIAWILKSIDLWILGKVDRLIILNLLLLVIIWLVNQIQLKNNQSILAVEDNRKN